MRLRPHVILAGLLAVGMCSTRSAEAADRLNVVFILADDLGWGETGCYGQQKIPTPNIDKLAKQGLRFTQHYSGAPVCAPSRCVLMTGKHSGHAEIRGNRPAKVAFPEFTEGQHPISDQVVTLAQVFQKAGYATGAMGKWGLGPVGSTGDPSRQGFDLFFGYNCQSVAHSYFPPHVWRNSEKIVINAKPIPGRQTQPEGEVKLADWQGEVYAPKLAIAEAEKFIESHKSRPFFLYLPFIEPHVAMHPPRESVEKFPAEWDDEAYRGQCGYLPHPRPRAGYAAMISNLDSYVGRVMAALDKAGVSERTLVVFSSDNGTTHAGQPDTHFHIGGVDAKFFNSTAGLRGYKGSLYEGGIRVPAIVRLPGKIKAGTVNDTPGYFADWFPTLCSAAGLTPPAKLDGESLWPVLTGGAAPKSRKPMVWVFPEYGGQVAVRQENFKVIRQGLKTKKPGEWQVYNLDKDPGEKVDLSDARADVIAQAVEVLKREVAENTVFPLTIPGVNDAAPAEAPPELPKKGAARKPNVLFIAIDDQNDWVGPLQGHPLVKTPHLDRLARRGTVFTNAHCQAPLCNPSRTSLLLGLRPTTTGIYGLAPWFRSLEAWQDRVSLPQHFEAHGYKTLTAGKIYHGGAGGPKQRAQEFDVWGPAGGVGAKPNQKLIPAAPMGNHPLMDWGVFPHRDEDKGDYQVATWAVEQIKAAPKDEPFFLAAGFFLPHVPCYVTQKWFDLYPDDDAILPEVKADDRADTPRFSWYLHWNLPEPRLTWVRENDQWRNLVRSYLASTSFVDAQIGRLLDALDESEQAENTVVVVWGDHGWHLGEKGITGKNTLWERSTRVPLIFAGPGVARGAKCGAPAELLDIYPTLVELCGLASREDLEGHSLGPQLRDANTRRESPAITSHNQGNHAIRGSRYRYIRYADGAEELYDLENDPREWTNLARKTTHAKTLDEHRRWLPKIDRPAAPGSAHRVLVYDRATDIAEWEGKPIRRKDPIPE